MGSQAGSAGHDMLAMARRYGLAGPAMFLLEVAQPLHSLIQQLLYAGHPLLHPWLGDRLLLWAGLLEDTAALQEAVQYLAATEQSGSTSPTSRP